MLLREQAGPISDKQRKMLEETERSCGRIGALISEMSELGKIEAGEVSVPAVSFDLAALVTEVAGGMHEDAGRGIRLDVRATQPLPVNGDRSRLAAALKALVHAAMRERGEPGTVIVECTTVPSGTHAWAVVTIGDETISQTLRANATATTPPAFDEWRGGVGLALPVGRRVIEAHGGALWSAPEPRPRAGSALRLPAAQ
jgi:signal transduction histidine kinase